VLRTLVLATHLLGVDRVMVVEHTDCRMAKVDDEQAHAAILEQSGVGHPQPGVPHHPGPAVDARAGRQRIRSFPYLPRDLAVIGCLYDVASGRVRVAVPQA
jgi:carbonic anhydrase